MVVVQVQLVHQRQRGSRAADLADGDGPVEGHDRGGGDGEQPVVQGDDLGPVGLLDGPSIGMHGVDGRLELIGTGLVAAKAAAEDRLAFLDQGLMPDCISTDLTVQGRNTSVHSLVEMMTRFLGLGFTLEQVITMCTVTPARILGEQERLGALAVGRQADVSVLEVRDGDWTVYDTEGASLDVTRAVVPVLTLKRGEVFEPEWGPHPWGWEPRARA